MTVGTGSVEGEEAGGEGEGLGRLWENALDLALK